MKLNEFVDEVSKNYPVSFYKDEVIVKLENCNVVLKKDIDDIDYNAFKRNFEIGGADLHPFYKWDGIGNGMLLGKDHPLFKRPYGAKYDEIFPKSDNFMNNPDDLFEKKGDDQFGFK